MKIHSLFQENSIMVDKASRKKQITSKRKEQILKAATEVFVRKGYTDATIPEIAKSCGLAAGTLYIYYSNKREIFIAVIESLIVRPLVDIFGKKSENNFPNTLKDAITNRMDFLQGDTLPCLLALMGEIQRDAELRKIYNDKLIKPFLEYMEKICRARIDSREFRKLEPEIVVRLIGSITIGMCVLQMTEGESSPLIHLSQQKLGDEISNFILHGLLKPVVTD
jgi:AcrR family transcriptional regulator